MNRRKTLQPVMASFLALLLLGLSGCGINNIPRYEEAVDAAWSQVENQYKRRADLVPNLVNTVKGFAEQEKDVLTAVVEARGKALGTPMSAEALNDPAAFEAFQANQAALSSALSRLLVVVEQYPQLKSDQNFLSLQSQLEGTENRIAVARRDYIEAVRLYNTELKTIPGRWWHQLMYRDAQARPQFTVSQADQVNPEVSF